MRRDTITINDILRMLLSKLKIIIIITLACGVLFYINAAYLTVPLYTTTSLLYVTNADELPGEIVPTTPEETEPTSSYGNKSGANDIVISAKIASVCETIFKTDIMMKALIEYSDLSVSIGQLKSMISVTAKDETQFLNVQVTSSDPEFAAEIANALPLAAQETYKIFFPYGKIIVANDAYVPTSPSSPNVGSKTAFGFLVGLGISITLAFILEIIDTTVKSRDDLYKEYKIPVFARIPDLDMDSKRSKKKNKKKKMIATQENFENSEE